MSKHPKKGVKPNMKPNVDAARKHYDAMRAALPPDVSMAEIAAKDPAIKYSPKKTEAAILVVLDWLAKGYSKGYACDKAGVATRTWDKWRQEDEELQRRHLAAVERGTDLFEDEARRRAIEGTDRPVFQQGDVVGHVREYSDTMLSMILPGRRAMYQRNRTEHTGEGGGPIVHKIEVEFVKPK